MKEQIELLEELNEIDRRARKIEEEAESFPHEIEKIENSLAEDEAVVNDLKESMENHETEKRDKDDDLSASSQNLSRFKARQREVKSNAEYHASQKEIDQAKKQMNALEDEILQLMETIEEEKEKLSQVEVELEEKRKKAEEEKKAILAKQKEAEAKMKKSVTEREKKKKSIDPKVIDIYESLKTKIKGNLLVSARNGTCMGCHLQIPPQLINDAMKLEKLHQCPHCLRILVVH